LKLLIALLYRAAVLPPGEMEYLSWIERAAEMQYERDWDAYLNGEIAPLF